MTTKEQPPGGNRGPAKVSGTTNDLRSYSMSVGDNGRRDTSGQFDIGIKNDIAIEPRSVLQRHAERQSDIAFWFGRGYQHGWSDGYAHAGIEQTREWIASIEDGPQPHLADNPSLGELQRRRTELPEDTDCTCQSCALRRSVVRRRGGDYTPAVAR